MDEKLDIKTAIKDTLPTVFGYIGIGLAFGIVGKAAGFHPLVVTLMSLLIYAGSAQFITVSMLASHSPLLSIVLDLSSQFPNDSDEYDDCSLFQEKSAASKSADWHIADR